MPVHSVYNSFLVLSSHLWGLLSFDATSCFKLPIPEISHPELTFYADFLSLLMKPSSELYTCYTNISNPTFNRRCTHPRQQSHTSDEQNAPRTFATPPHNGPYHKLWYNTLSMVRTYTTVSIPILQFLQLRLPRPQQAKSTCCHVIVNSRRFQTLNRPESILSWRPTTTQQQINTRFTQS